MISPKEQLVRLAEWIEPCEFRYDESYEHVRDELNMIIKKLEDEENESTN